MKKTLRNIILTVLLSLFLQNIAEAVTFYFWRYREHATDCTSLTDGLQRDLCKELDDDKLYYCETVDGTCNTAGEWKDITAAGGDSVLIDGVGVTNPDFVSTGDIDFVDTSNVVTANLNIDVVAAAEMADADHGDVSWSGGVATVDSGAVLYHEIGDPTANSNINMNGYDAIYTFDNPSGAFTVRATGNYTAHGVFNVEQLTGNPGASHLVHIEAEDPDVVNLDLKHTQDTASFPMVTYEGDRATPTDSDEFYFSYLMSDSAGNQDEFFRFSMVGSDITATTEDASLTWDLMQAGTLTEVMVLNSLGLLQTDGGFTTVGTIEGATLTEGGNAVYNSSETPGGELGGTWASPTVDATHSGTAHHVATVDTNLTQEEVEDFAGVLIANGTGTHTGIAVTYQDVTNDIDLIIDHDTANNFLATEHIDWAGSGAGTIHATNYVDNNTTYSTGGTLLDLTGTTFSINEGTLTDTKVCTYEVATGLNCNTTISGVGADDIGTSELDDGADTPLAGEWVQVDPADTTQFNYRTDAELLSDSGAAVSGGAEHDGFSDFSATEHVPEASISHDTIAGVSTSDHHTATVDTTLDLAGVETITGNWVNTTNPWADNEVADDITASNYLLLAGGVLTGEITVDDLGLEFAAGDALTDCSTYSATGGGIFYDDSEGVFKKCQDNVLTDLDTSGGFTDIDTDYGVETVTSNWTFNTGTVSLDGIVNIGASDIQFDGTTPKKRVYISATAGICRTTTGCTDPTQTETTTNKINYFPAVFADDADDYWQASFITPENWDGGTITYAYDWIPDSDTTSGGVSVFMQCMSVANDQALDSAFGTAIEVSDDWTVAGDFLESSESGAVTCTGAAGGEQLHLQLYRDVDDADDDLAGGANDNMNLLGMWITFGIDQLSTED